MPEEVIPLRSYRLSLDFGRMYVDAGRPDELETRLERAMKQFDLRADDKVYLAVNYWQFLKNYAKAESLCVAALDEQPTHTQAVGTLINIYEETERFDKAVEALQKYVAFRPDDPYAKSQLAKFKAKLAADDSLEAPVEKAIPADGNSQGSGEKN